MEEFKLIKMFSILNQPHYFNTFAYVKYLD